MKNDGILGIVGCYSLSDQVLYLIDRDDEIENLLVINNPEGLRFVEKTREHSVGKKVDLVPDDQFPLRKMRGFTVVLWFNPPDLHNNPLELQQAQSEALTKICPQVDSVLFCYGLCRSSEERIKNVMKEAIVPVTFLTDYAGEIVDDCFAAILGGKMDYLNLIKKHRGALFASSGYVEAWREKYKGMDIELIIREVEGLKHMFDALGYCQILVLDDGLGDRESLERDVLTFSKVFDLEIATRRCGREVFEQSYDLAKLKIERRKIFQLGGLMAEPSPSDTILPE